MTHDTEAAGAGGKWIDPYKGFNYTPEEVTVTRDWQAEKLTAAGVDPAVFGDLVDPSFFIGLAIQAGIHSGITAQGNVNMVQYLQQHQPAQLDEPLRIEGQIVDVRPVPRGRTLHTHVTFYNSANEAVISANRISLKPDPNAATKQGAGTRPEPLVGDPAQLTRGDSFTLTPEAVKAYSTEGNSIHYEEEAAKAAGFRAPLIGGGMGVHYLLAALWEEQSPQAFTSEIYFRRPIFWDETVQACRSETGAIRALLKSAETKVGTEMALSGIR